MSTEGDKKVGLIAEQASAGTEGILKRLEKTDQSLGGLDHSITKLRNAIFAVLFLLFAETGIMIHQINKHGHDVAENLSGLKKQISDLGAILRQSSSPTDAALPPRNSLSD